MNKTVKIIGVIIILLVIIVFALYYSLSTSEPRYLRLRSGDTINIQGEVFDVSYRNTSYGSLPVISLNSSRAIFEKANLLDEGIYDIEGWNGTLCINGDFDEEYNQWDELNVVLHFEEFQFSGSKFFWFKKLGVHLDLLMAIETAFKGTSNLYDIGLIHNSTIDGQYINYDILIKDNDTFPLDELNITLLKITTNVDYKDNILFSEAFKNLLELLSDHYIYATGGGGEIIDFMDSLGNISENNLIEFFDKNSNSLLDNNDTITVYIPPTSNETIFDAYILDLGGGFLYNRLNNASGFRYIVNWYKGAFETLI